MTEQYESVVRRIISILSEYNKNIRLDEENIKSIIEEYRLFGYLMILMESGSSWPSDFDLYCLAAIARQANMVIVKDHEHDIWLGDEDSILSRSYFTTHHFERNWTVYR